MSHRNLLVFALVVVFVLLFTHPVASSSPFTIQDGDATALALAITAANDETTHPGHDIIELAPNGFYKLRPEKGCSVNFPRITSAITIHGHHSVIRVGCGDLTPDPYPYTPYSGALTIFVVAPNGELSVDDAIITGGFQHGSIYDLGGGIYNGGTLYLNNVLLTQNMAEDGGGNLYNSGTAIIRNSALSRGTSNGRGGAIYNSGTVDIVNSTVMSNGNNGIYNTGTMTFSNVTLSNNGQGIVNQGGTITFRNTIIADQCSNPALQGYFISLDDNIEIGDTCSLTAVGDLPNTAPHLTESGFGGGLTPTMPLDSTSPAIDHVTHCVTVSGEPITQDQRGIQRPQGTACDVGAFELTVCTDLDPKRDLKHSQTYLGNPDLENDSISGIVTNHSSTCIYTVGLAVYQMFDDTNDHQQLFNSGSAAVYPGQTLTMSGFLPNCAAQIDLFHGEVLKDLNGQRYGERLLDVKFTGGNFCGQEDNVYEPDPPVDEPSTPPIAETDIPTVPDEPLPQTVCTPNPTHDLKHNQSFIQQPSGAETIQGQVLNLSPVCSYKIGIASYQKFDDNIDNQVLFHGQTVSIGPGETITVSTNVPDCAAQIDLFYGDTLPNFSGGVRYGSRLLDAKHISDEIWEASISDHEGQPPLTETLPPEQTLIKEEQLAEPLPEATEVEVEIAPQDQENLQDTLEATPEVTP